MSTIKIRNIQESNRKLEGRLLNEQQLRAATTYSSGSVEQSPNPEWTGNRRGDILTKLTPNNSHELLTVLQIATAFIPVAGLFISAGIGLLDAKIYYDEGDTKTAGMVAMFSVLPGVGALTSKIPGIKQLGAKGMTLLASKLGKGTGVLSSVEKDVLLGLKTNEALVKSELNNSVKNMAQKSLSSNINPKVKSSLTTLAKTGLKLGGVVAPYVAAGAAYDKGYDYFNKPNIDFNTISVDKISDVNKEAARNAVF